MKAWVLEQPKPVEENPLSLRDVKTPEPASHELLIKVTACGACHTDIQTVEGKLPLPKLPLIPGHQVVGRVEKTGGANSFKAGERVGVSWLHSTCGSCRYCLTGRENLCEKSELTGYHVNGGYAEYMTAPEEFVFPLPEIFDDVHAAPLMCGGIIGYRGLRLAGIKKGSRLGLFNFGLHAHIVIQIAVNEGAEVYAFSQKEEHRKHAMELGAKWAGLFEDDPPVKLTSAITFTSAGSVIPAAMEKLEKDGTLVMLGVSVEDIPAFDHQKHFANERKIQTVTNLTRKDAVEFLETASSIPIKTDVELFGFEEAGEVLKKLKAGKVKGAAVIGFNI